MIDFSYQTNFKLSYEKEIAGWIADTIVREGFEEGDVSYVFCDDAFLVTINKEFLNHDTFTDIISFDYSHGTQVHGEIYISIQRVLDNANKYDCKFLDELHRVMIHGILHYCGYMDKTTDLSAEMRRKEEEALSTRLFL